MSAKDVRTDRNKKHLPIPIARVPTKPKRRPKNKPVPLKETISTEMQIQFGENVKARRNELGISQQELSAITGYSQQYHSKVEAGEMNVKLDTMQVFAKALDTTIYALLGIQS